MFSSWLIIGGDWTEREKKAFLKIEEISGEKNWEKINPDLEILHSQTAIGIEEIRQLQTKLSLKPFAKKIKVALIVKAENLTPEAQNSLLKTLEEPPANSLIILLAPDTGWLLPTIVSRCQIITLNPKEQIFLSPQESADFEKTFQKIINSSLGERWQILENLEIGQDRLKAQEFLTKMVFLTRKHLLANFLEKKETSSPTAVQYLNILASLSQSQFFLQSNTNVRLTLEVLFQKLG